METVDLFPTLAELCGLALPAGLDGRSLRSHLENPGTKTTKPALSFWTNGQRTIRNERWRLIAHAPASPGEAPPTELFDMIADPDEAKNLASSQPDVVARLLKQLRPPLEARAGAGRK